MAEPHERHEFTHAVTYTVAITYTVAGGARHGTADRQAERIAARLADAAARAKGVVEVTAQAGHSHDGKLLAPQRVRFSAANTGQGTHREPTTLDRYVGPDREIALESLAAANTAYRAREEANRNRRLEAGCRYPYQATRADGVCSCVYCQPERHYAALQDHRRAGPSPFIEYRCICGTSMAAFGDRCQSHRNLAVTVLDGDGSALQLLARDAQRQHVADEPPSTDHDLDG